MNSYKPYRNAGFMDGTPMPPAIAFETTEELLALEDVRQTHRNDSQYVMSDGYLMELNKDGFEWWVLGKISDPATINLPIWKGPKIKVQLNDGRETIVEGDEVKSMCGDEITLKNGDKARRLK